VAFGGKLPGPAVLSLLTLLVGVPLSRLLPDAERERGAGEPGA